MHREKRTVRFIFLLKLELKTSIKNEGNEKTKKYS